MAQIRDLRGRLASAGGHGHVWCMTYPPSGPPKPEAPRADIVLRAGFPEAQRDRAAALYWRAFQDKLHRLMGPETKALSFFRQVADPEFAISALGPDGRLLGVAGFKTAEGGFMGGEMADLRAVYGGLGALWRGLGLSVLERPVAPGVLLMDGIMVEASARGQGIGRALLTAIKQTARAWVRAGAARCDRHQFKGPRSL